MIGLEPDPRERDEELDARDAAAAERRAEAGADVRAGAYRPAHGGRPFTAKRRLDDDA